MTDFPALQKRRPESIRCQLWAAIESSQYAPTGNCFRPLCTAKVDKHFGDPVFFSVLSKAHTFSTGSFNRSSDIVTNNDVPSTCFMRIIEPVSCALNDLMTLKAWERIQTWPSLLPRNKLSDPVQTQLKSLLLRCQHLRRPCVVRQATHIE